MQLSLTIGKLIPNNIHVFLDTRIIELKESVFKNNDEKAEELRKELTKKGIFLLNVMSSPSSGKTTTLIPIRKH